jgi:tRNA-dihydrouridine synthase B
VSVPRTHAAALHPIVLRGVTLASNLVLAPMAGVSNLPFRLIAREAGAALCFTETVSAKGLVVGGAKTWRLLRTSPREAPVAFQLFGSDPEVLGEAARRLADEGAAWIDLNVGCPVKKFIRNCAGSALLRDLPRAAAIVRAIRAGFHGIVSVKMRTGWDEASIVAPELARIAVAEGAELLSVHGRTRAQQYTGRARRDRIREVVDAVSGTPVLANGDVVSAPDVFDMLRDTGAAGVMIGRGALGNPWIFEQALSLASSGTLRRPSREQRLATIERHVSLMASAYDDRSALAANLKKYVTAYAKGLRGSAAFREHVLRAADADAMIDLARAFFSDCREAA